MFLWTMICLEYIYEYQCVINLSNSGDFLHLPCCTQNEKGLNYGLKLHSPLSHLIKLGTKVAKSLTSKKRHANYFPLCPLSFVCLTG